MDAQLYAQTNASAQTVPLLLRRMDPASVLSAKNQREFFPLTGVSYVVIRVSALPPEAAAAQHESLPADDPVSNAVRLQYILRLNSMLRSFAQ